MDIRFASVGEIPGILELLKQVGKAIVNEAHSVTPSLKIEISL